MPRRQKPDEHTLELINEEKWVEVSALFSSYHPADIADIIDHVPSETRAQLFSMLNSEVKSSVLAELEDFTKEEIIELLSNQDLSDMLEEMSPDDAADVMGELPEERHQQVLALMEKKESEDVRKLLKYDEETAGGIMTTDVVAMHSDQTVEEAIEAIAYMDTKEQFFKAHLVDAQERMIGFVNVWELLRERNKTRKLGEMAHTEFIAATVDMDQEEVARLINQYDFNAIPVVDSEGKLVGRVTSDDVIDIMEDEASEDILRLAGSDEEELEDISPLRSCLIRLPWLFITLIGGIIVAMILRKYTERLDVAGVLVLASFVPSVFAMAGNTGIQSSTLLVRSIALGHVNGRKQLLSTILHEVAVGAVMGILCGLFIGGTAFGLLVLNPAEASFSPLRIACIVSLALFASMTFAAVFGAIVPTALNKMKIDPAIASGPFITIANDVAALLIYFGITFALI